MGPRRGAYLAAAALARIHARMTSVAFLRAVNVGGRNLVAMSELRGLFEDLGFHGARTLLQSGNVVFDGGRKAGGALERLLEARTQERLKVRTDYMLRTAGELEEVVAANPFPREAKEAPARLLVVFLKAAAPPAAAAALRSAVRGPELVRVAGRHAYIVYPDGAGRSKLTNALIEAKLGARGTARNWNTVLKLLALTRP